MRHRRGFTLIELLVVISVLGVVTSVGVQMFNAVGGSQKTQEIRLALANKADSALESIGKDISQVVSAQLGGTAIHGDQQLEENRRFGRVSLEDDRINLPIQQSATPGGPAERRIVTYAIDRTNPALALIRTVDPLNAKPGEGAAQEVVEGVLSMRIEYFDGSAWQRDWSAPKHPEAVRVSIVVRDDNRIYEQVARTMTFPIRVN